MQSLLNSGAPHAAIWAAERQGSVRGRVTSVPAAAGAACPVGGEAAASLLIPRRALRQPASRVSVLKKKKSDSGVYTKPGAKQTLRGGCVISRFCLLNGRSEQN